MWSKGGFLRRYREKTVKSSRDIFSKKKKKKKRGLWRQPPQHVSPLTWDSRSLQMKGVFFFFKKKKKKKKKKEKKERKNPSHSWLTVFQNFQTWCDKIRGHTWHKIRPLSRPGNPRVGVTALREGEEVSARLVRKACTELTHAEVHPRGARAAASWKKDLWCLLSETRRESF